MKNKKVFIISLLTLVLFALSACNKADENEDNKITIKTTVYPLQYFAERIGGDAVTVQSIYPPGADEHHSTPLKKI